MPCGPRDPMMFQAAVTLSSCLLATLVLHPRQQCVQVPGGPTPYISHAANLIVPAPRSSPKHHHLPALLPCQSGPPLGALPPLSNWLPVFSLDSVDPVPLLESWSDLQDSHVRSLLSCLEPAVTPHCLRFPSGGACTPQGTSGPFRGT